MEITSFFQDFGRTHRFKKRTPIYNQGEQSQGLYKVVSGLVGLYHTSENGHERLFRIFKKGDVFGHRTLIADDLYHATSITLVDSVLIHISRDDAKSLILKSREFCCCIGAKLADELKEAELRINDSTEKSSRRRIIESIMYLKARFPNHVWSRKDIAEYAGAQTETVTRVIKDLESAHLIIKKGRDIDIPDYSNLEDYIDEI